MEPNNDFNIGLRKENFWSTINKTKGFESEFWIGEMKVSTDMDNVVFLNTNAPPKNFEAEGFKGSFKDDTLVITFDFDRFRNWSGADSSPEKMLKALDIVLATFGIGIHDWSQVFENEVTYNLKVSLSSKDRIILYDLLEKKRSKITGGSINENWDCYYFSSLGTLLEFKRDPANKGSIIHISVKMKDHYSHQYMVDFVAFFYLGFEEAADILNREVGPFFRLTESFESESEWFKLMEMVSGLKPRETVDKAIERIQSIQKYSPALANPIAIDLYEEFVGESFGSIINKSMAWLKASESLRFEFQQTLRFLKMHERIIRYMDRIFQIRKVGSDEAFIREEDI
ncbi:hypothetical protein [Leptospira kirschneri]|uniref:hypothetical protein n=1 Tax=Leptospira kirschneri TaxID=29507 RepID=UPI0035626499